MKTGRYSLLLLMLLFAFGCEKGIERKVYQPRDIVKGEDFNTYAKGATEPLAVFTASGETSANQASGEKERFTIKLRDTVIAIQPNAKDKDYVVDKFALARFVNTQKTTLLVQLADSTGLVAPFYLVNLKGDQLEVVNLYRSSKGKRDAQVTKGMTKVGSRGYLINNDFFVTNVNAKVYFIDRQNPDERIQGDFFVQSSDKQTFVFLLEDALYEVHYPSGETFTQPFPSNPPSTPAALFRWIQSNFSWSKNNKGIMFLKADADDNRIVDIKEFK